MTTLLAIIHDSRFLIVIYEVLSFMVVWFAAYLISLLTKGRWINASDMYVETFAYTCWIIAIGIHLLFVACYNGYQWWVWHYELEESPASYWPFAALYLGVIVLDVILILTLSKKKSKLTTVYA